MSIISKIKMPGMADAYDIGVDWENVKDKPDVGSIDVGVTNEVLNIDTNDDIAVSGNGIPDYTNVDEGYVLRRNDVGGISWEQGGAVMITGISSLVYGYINDFVTKVVENNRIQKGKAIYFDEVLDDFKDQHPNKILFTQLTTLSIDYWLYLIQYYGTPIAFLDKNNKQYISSISISGNHLLITVNNFIIGEDISQGYIINGTFYLPLGQEIQSWDNLFIGEIIDQTSEDAIPMIFIG